MENNNLYDVKEKWLDITKLQIGKSIYTEIIEERNRQDAKWGEQNHQVVAEMFNSLDDYGIVNEEQAKYLCNEAASNGFLKWSHIIVEELSEAIHAKTKEEMRKELIETAACCVAAIESLDRNEK